MCIRDRVLDERGLIDVEQDPAQTAIGGILRGDRYRGQAGAVEEYRGSDAGDAPGDGYAGQAGTVCECIASDAGDTVGDRDVAQAAGIERIIPDIGDAVGDCDAGQRGACLLYTSSRAALGQSNGPNDSRTLSDEGARLYPGSYRGLSRSYRG